MELTNQGLTNGRTMRQQAAEQLLDLHQVMRRYIDADPEIQEWSTDQAVQIMNMTMLAVLSLTTAMCEYIDPQGPVTDVSPPSGPQVFLN